MSQKFYKGRTNNHLTWVAVDSTDFATPESAMSAATTITIYGKVRGATTLHTVSTGTGSLTNDIIHVGASATGIYTIALVKADLSDASQAWYDQYICVMTGTGMAQQVLVVDGGIDDSYMSDAASNLLSRITAVVPTSAIVSDIYSMLVALSDAISNVDSAVNSQYSDLLSTLGSQFTAHSSIHSDIYSALVALSDAVSNVDSAVNSQYSDVLSTLGSMFAALSDAISNVDSAVNSQYSDLLSTLGSQFAVESNYLSYISGVVSGLGAGASASAIADKVWSDFESKTGASPSQLYSVTQRAASHASDAHSAALLVQSMVSDVDSALTSQFAHTSGMLSDIYSGLSDFHSDFGSRVPKAVATNSQLSDLHSDLLSYLTGISAVVSDAHSGALLAASHASNVYSALTTARNEPGTSAPAMSKDVLGKVDYLYKAWRNTTQQDATSYVLYNDDGTTAGQKATVADDGASFTRGEVGSG